MVIATAQLHSTEITLKFCTDSNMFAADLRFTLVRTSDNPNRNNVSGTLVDQPLHRNNQKKINKR